MKSLVYIPWLKETKRFDHIWVLITRIQGYQMRKKTHIFIMCNPRNVLLNDFSRMSLQDVAVRMTCVDIRPAVWTCLLICKGNVELSVQGKCHRVNNMHSVKWHMNTMLCRTQLGCYAWVMCWGVMSEGGLNLPRSQAFSLSQFWMASSTLLHTGQLWY